MTIQRRRAIYTIAEKIRSFLELQTPANLYFAIREILQGEYIEGQLDDDISGKIEKNGETFRITLNSTDSERRKRFTLAHELGHLFLHMGYMLDMEKWKTIDAYIDSPYYRVGYSEEEYEANQFAGALLMPEDEYRNYVNTHVNKNRTVDISLIGSYFNVSDEAALTRGRWLGMFDWN
jgi:Zn-dependent peptidase ImmA (M78 family)